MNEDTENQETRPESPPEAGKIVQINEAEIRSHLDRMVLRSVEDTLNTLLEAEADRLCGAARYERSPDRVDTHLRQGNVVVHSFSISFE